MALILIVDDSVYQRTLARQALEQAGHTVREAANGREGMAAIQTFSPDCMILNLIMPEMDGISVLRQLRRQSVDFPVIVMSADVQHEVHEECRQLGAAAVLTKPVPPDVLSAAIAKVVARREEDAA